jgi:membrane-anchored protein YejM (alkaline phosphatase superfamily)
LNIIHWAPVVAVFLSFARMLLPAASAQADNSDGTNILIILADDIGYGDLGCYGGSELKTPRIDAFAAENLRLTDCYSAHPNCAASRPG